MGQFGKYQNKQVMTKHVFNPGNYPKNIDISLLLLRLAGGGFMLTHSIGKFFKLFGDAPIAFADPLGVGVTASLALTVFAEVLCALSLMVGFATRFSAIPLLITMLVAAFVVHANDGFGKQELPLLYAVIYFVIAITGAGKYAIDSLIFKK